MIPYLIRVAREEKDPDAIIQVLAVLGAKGTSESMDFVLETLSEYPEERVRAAAAAIVGGHIAHSLIEGGLATLPRCLVCQVERPVAGCMRFCCELLGKSRVQCSLSCPIGLSSRRHGNHPDSFSLATHTGNRTPFKRNGAAV